jgi:hypothetical protein
MRTFFLPLMVICCAILTCCRPAQADAPKELAGFTLGQDLPQSKNGKGAQHPVPIQHQEHLSEVEIQGVAGFRSFCVDIGNCCTPRRIVRIKAKFAYSEKKFYEKLLKLYKQRFGEPTEWKGNAFHTFVAWKWSFKDKEGNSISLILQHGMESEEDYTSGNTVKLTNWTAVEKERACYNADHREPGAPETAEATGESDLRFPEDYQRFVPN